MYVNKEYISMSFFIRFFTFPNKQEMFIICIIYVFTPNKTSDTYIKLQLCILHNTNTVQNAFR